MVSDVHKEARRQEANCQSVCLCRADDCHPIYFLVSMQSNISKTRCDSTSTPLGALGYIGGDDLPGLTLWLPGHIRLSKLSLTARRVFLRSLIIIQEVTVAFTASLTKAGPDPHPYIRSYRCSDQVRRRRHWRVPRRAQQSDRRPGG
jgi:hypothetical protein